MMLCSVWSCIRDGEVWHWYRRDGCHETGADYEVDNSRGHVGHHCNLRLGRSCVDFQRYHQNKLHAVSVSTSSIMLRI